MKVEFYRHALGVEREERAEFRREFVAQLDGGGVPTLIDVVIGAAPILPARHDRLGDAAAREERGVLHGVADGGAFLRARAAEHRGRRGLEIVEAAIEERPNLFRARGLDLELADAVGLHPGEVGDGIESVRAGAEDIGGGLIGEDDVRLAVALIGALEGHVEGGARGDLPAQGCGAANEIAP